MVRPITGEKCYVACSSKSNEGATEAVGSACTAIVALILRSTSESRAGRENLRFSVANPLIGYVEHRGSPRRKQIKAGNHFCKKRRQERPVPAETSDKDGCRSQVE